MLWRLKMADMYTRWRKKMNPKTGKFEELSFDTSEEAIAKYVGDKARRIRQAVNQEARITGQLLRPNGEPVPKHWAVFAIDELVEIKGNTFKVKYIGETSILFEPVSVKEISDRLLKATPESIRRDIENNLWK